MSAAPLQQGEQQTQLATSIHPRWRSELRGQPTAPGKARAQVRASRARPFTLAELGQSMLPGPDDLDHVVRDAVAAVRRPYNSDQTLELSLAAFAKILARWQGDKGQDPLFLELQVLTMALAHERGMQP